MNKGAICAFVNLNAFTEQIYPAACWQRLHLCAQLSFAWSTESALHWQRPSWLTASTVCIFFDYTLGDCFTWSKLLCYATELSREPCFSWLLYLFWTGSFLCCPQKHLLLPCVSCSHKEAKLLCCCLRSTVLSACRGDQVSFYTTVGGGGSVMDSKDCNFFLYPYIHLKMKVFKSTKPS